MHSIALLSVLMIALLAIKSINANESHWGYPDLDTGEEFPIWGGVCETGTRQSPINLNIKGSLKGVFDNLQFRNYSEKQKGVSVINTGHSVQLSGFPLQMELLSGPLHDKYVVEQIHLHWWSEHTIDNIRYPLEVHIVHRNRRYPNMTIASNSKDGLTVVGVLYHVSNDKNDAIDEIIDILDNIKKANQINQPVRMKNSFVVKDLFPKLEGYLTYAGSLTTPSCAESVTWIVLQKTFPVTLEQVDKFKELENEDGKPLKNNYRFTQKAHNRAVVVVLPEVYKGNSAVGTWPMSIGSTLLMLLVVRWLQ